jgi:glycosyltransferase involved in cell wall biosynthesis
VPAPKGASTHIEAFTRALAAHFGAVELVTVSDVESHTESWPGVFHTELPGVGRSLIDRVLCFRGSLERWLVNRTFDIVQFRSIFEGLPLLRLRPRPKLIFEVNGLPSIELKERYPAVADDRELMTKLFAQEAACLQAADRVVTPSGVTARYLVERRGVESAKVRVIPNGVDTVLFHPSGQAEAPAPQDRLLYFGTLSQWQGVDLAVRAAAQISAKLTILGAGSNRQREAISALAAKLGAPVDVLPAVPQTELVAALHQSFAVLAPLTLSERNVVQGCCPLKILESMAAGIPVIASDLPVVRELEVNCLLVKPGSVDQIAQAVLQLRASPELWRKLSVEGRRQVEERYTWECAATTLVAVYKEISS